MRRALIGLDGNCGFAGLGELPTAPHNEWVFVEIKGDVADKDNQESAISAALTELRKNVAPEEITYELDQSHPRYL